MSMLLFSSISVLLVRLPTFSSSFIEQMICFSSPQPAAAVAILKRIVLEFPSPAGYPILYCVLHQFPPTEKQQGSMCVYVPYCNFIMIVIILRRQTIPCYPFYANFILFFNWFSVGNLYEKAKMRGGRGL